MDELYTRRDLYDVLEVSPERQGGDWNTGYHQHEGAWFIFANVGGPGRTGHDYSNQWVGNRLVWEGATGSHIGQSSIEDIVSGRKPVHIFTRSTNTGPFHYRGIGTAVEVRDTSPVTVVWAFLDPEQDPGIHEPSELAATGNYREGSGQTVTVNRYERHRQARTECIEHYGLECTVCGMTFEDKYGSVGEGYIHVHHLKELSQIGEEYTVDPVADLRPVCPNCHAIIHRRRPAYSIEEAKGFLSSHS